MFLFLFFCFGLIWGFPFLFLFCYMCDQCEPLVESIAALNTDDVRTNRLDMDGPTVKSTVSSHIATLSWNEISKSVFIKKNAKFSIFINIFTWLKGLKFQLYTKNKSFLLYSVYLILSHQVLTHTNIFMRYVDAIMHRIILGSPRNSLHQRNFLPRYVWRKVFNSIQNIDKFSFHSCL